MIHDGPLSDVALDRNGRVVLNTSFILDDAKHSIWRLLKTEDPALIEGSRAIWGDNWRDVLRGLLKEANKRFG